MYQSIKSLVLWSKLHFFLFLTTITNRIEHIIENHILAHTIHCNGWSRTNSHTTFLMAVIICTTDAARVQTTSAHEYRVARAVEYLYCDQFQIQNNDGGIMIDFYQSNFSYLIWLLLFLS